jgi:hypothetical protein
MAGTCRKKNATSLLLVPPGVVTTTEAAPAARTGVVAVIWVAELTVKDAAGVPPKVTAEAPVNPVPEIV